jgi:hypothetical protein
MSLAYDTRQTDSPKLNARENSAYDSIEGATPVSRGIQLVVDCVEPLPPPGGCVAGGGKDCGDRHDGEQGVAAPRSCALRESAPLSAPVNHHENRDIAHIPGAPQRCACEQPIGRGPNQPIERLQEPAFQERTVL